MNRFINNLYTKEIIVFKDHQYSYLENDDGTLFSGQRKTKILAQDLPAWYVYGRYYKRWGYMSTKSITDMLYVPDKLSNHYLKDDCLYISYGGKIREIEPSQDGSSYEKHTGFDEKVWGNEIIGILKGARLYSNYDISGFIQQLKNKTEWLIREYPEEFGADKWNFDMGKCFAEYFKTDH
ncbi:hypothetical protein [uncultured Oscillibacter sp.]|uniref:hypothetical protein n=1 Tax=uncultured Oscillibacter sp. TaxID=876091 RepID=UPI0025E24190|nr:hypothetical protein [uncultured Oscillibacter sp.]